MPESENKPMTIKEGWFCSGADFDAEEPFILISNEEHCLQEEKILIPESVAYYLRTHWCGSKKMHDSIEKHTTQDFQRQFKEILGID